MSERGHVGFMCTTIVHTGGWVNIDARNSSSIPAPVVKAIWTSLVVCITTKARVSINLIVYYETTFFESTGSQPLLAASRNLLSIFFVLAARYLILDIITSISDAVVTTLIIFTFLLAMLILATTLRAMQYWHSTNCACKRHVIQKMLHSLSVLIIIQSTRQWNTACDWWRSHTAPLRSFREVSR